MSEVLRGLQTKKYVRGTIRSKCGGGRDGTDVSGYVLVSGSDGGDRQVVVIEGK